MTRSCNRRVKRSRRRFNAIRAQSAIVSLRRSHSICFANGIVVPARSMQVPDNAEQPSLPGEANCSHVPQLIQSEAALQQESLDPHHSMYESPQPLPEQDLSMVQQAGTLVQFENALASVPHALRDEFWLWAIIQTSGSTRFTRNQYQSVRRLLQKATEINVSQTFANVEEINLVSLPHDRTLSRVTHNFVMEHLCVRSDTLCDVPVDMSKRGSRAMSRTSDGTPTTEVAYVSPMDYAQADLENPRVFEQMKASSQNQPTSARASSVDFRGRPEDALIVKARLWFYDDDYWISVDDASTSSGMPYAEVGDKVSVALATSTANLRSVLQLYSPTNTAVIHGEIREIFTVHHISTPNEEIVRTARAGSLLPDDQLTIDIRNRFFRMDYKWPTSTASRSSHPLLQPADVVAIISPMNNVSTTRILLVHRFAPAQGERSRFVLLFTAAGNMQAIGTSSASLTFQHCFEALVRRATHPSCGLFRCDIRSVGLLNAHREPRGPQRFELPHVLGVLSDGRKYAIYRFFIYHDGFVCFAGRSATATGVYMQPLCMLAKYRTDPNTARMISIIPPGVCLSVVLRRLRHDLIRGMTEGSTVIDANGDERVVFLDFLGFLGDTPGLNGVLDVGGHNANAFCHLCRICKGSNQIIGNEFIEDTTWLRTTHRRTAAKQFAVRNMSAPSVVLQKLGMKQNPGQVHNELYLWRSDFSTARRSVPKTDSSIPVVACAFDPFAGSFVAPDHLLGGHFRDCLTLAFRALPNARKRRLFDRTLVGMLADSGLDIQTRVYDADENRVLSMSISHLYALMTVCSRALEVTFRSLAENELTETLRCSQKLLSSTAKLSSAWWQHFEQFCSTTGPSEVVDTIRNIHNSRIHRLYKEHFDLIRTVCFIDDEEALQMLDEEGKRRKPQHLSKAQNDSLAAIHELSKPNTHRLRELWAQWWAYGLHLVWIGELSLERTHQTFKRIVAAHSNNHNVHIAVMRAARFNDWQKRLHSAVEESEGRVVVNTRLALRLLTGIVLNSSPSDAVYRKAHSFVSRVLKPNGIVFEELGSQGMALMSIHRTSEGICPRHFDFPKLATVSMAFVRSYGGNACTRMLQSGWPRDRTGLFLCTSYLRRTCACGLRRQRIDSNDVIVFENFDITVPLRMLPVEEQYSTAQCDVWQLLLFAPFDELGNFAFALVAVRARRMLFRQNDTLRFDVDSTNEFRVMRIAPCNVFWKAVHNCGKFDCSISSSDRKIIHNHPVRDQFILMNERNGFPPRTG